MKNSETTILDLPEVGCGIDLRTMITYPAFADGGYDLENDTHISECSDEFLEKLSKESLLKILNAKRYK
jgi:hypothetical protein